MERPVDGVEHFDYDELKWQPDLAWCGHVADLAMLRSITPELVSADADANTMIAVGELIQRPEHTRLTARAEFADRFADYDSPATRRSFGALIEAISA